MTLAKELDEWQKQVEDILLPAEELEEILLFLLDVDSDEDHSRELSRSPRLRARVEDLIRQCSIHPSLTLEYVAEHAIPPMPYYLIQHPLALHWINEGSNESRELLRQWVSHILVRHVRIEIEKALFDTMTADLIAPARSKKLVPPLVRAFHAPRKILDDRSGESADFQAQWNRLDALAQDDLMDYYVIYESIERSPVSQKASNVIEQGFGLMISRNNAPIRAFSGALAMTKSICERLGLPALPPLFEHLL